MCFQLSAIFFIISSNSPILLFCPHQPAHVASCSVIHHKQKYSNLYRSACVCGACHRTLSVFGFTFFRSFMVLDEKHFVSVRRSLLPILAELQIMLGRTGGLESRLDAPRFIIQKWIIGNALRRMCLCAIASEQRKTTVLCAENVKALGSGNVRRRTNRMC